MAKNRPAIPRAIRDTVLSEYNHRCAVCGKERPQIHHIDEDPSNNDALNLIPLCPNCHLIDQHNPTVPIEPAKLRLFRRYKDPVILGPQFDPLFKRLRFLDDIPAGAPVGELQAKGRELAAFINALQMGGFYSPKISILVKKVEHVEVVDLYDSGDTASEEQRRKAQYEEEYREKLRAAREQIYELAIELLRYQNWEPPKQKPSI